MTSSTRPRRATWTRRRCRQRPSAGRRRAAPRTRVAVSPQGRTPPVPGEEGPPALSASVQRKEPDPVVRKPKVDAHEDEVLEAPSCALDLDLPHGRRRDEHLLLGVHSRRAIASLVAASSVGSSSSSGWMRTSGRAAPRGGSGRLQACPRGGMLGEASPGQRVEGHTGCGAAWLARLTGGQEVAGSNPASPTRKVQVRGSQWPGNPVAPLRWSPKW